MKNTLTICAAAFLASTTSAIDTSSIPQISAYPIPAIAYTALKWGTSWSSGKNIKDAGFKAIDANIGLYGTYAIDTSYNVWNYSTLTDAKSATWNDHGI